MPSFKRSKQKHAANSAEGSTPAIDSNSRASPQPSSKPSESAASLPEQPPSSSNQPADPQTPNTSNETTAASAGNSVKDSGNGSIKSVRQSWYGGSWRAKAAPIAQVAKQSIGVAQGSTSELSTQDKKKPAAESGSNSPAQYLTGSMRRPSKGNPAVASATKVNVTSESANASRSSLGAQNDGTPNPAPPQPEPSREEGKEGDKEDGKRKEATQNTGGFASRWTGWWSRPDGQSEQQEPEAKGGKDAVSPSEEPKDGKAADLVVEEAPKPAEDTTADSSEKQDQPRSWFWLWSSTQNAKDSQSDNKTTEDDGKPADGKPSEPATAPDGPQDAKDTPTQTKDSEAVAPNQDQPPVKEVPTKASAWAFWSSSKAPTSDGNAKGSDDTKKYVGELAVADTPSQSNPEAAQFNEQQSQDEPQDPPKKKSRLSLVKDAAKASAKSTPSQSPVRKPAEDGPAVKERAGPPNHVLPSFTDTYPPMRSQTYWQIIRKYFVGDDKSTPHLTVNTSPPRIRKALTIGVHGYFPTAIVQAVIGQPTGTSIRFANSAAAAIRAWAVAHGQTDLEIETVALEGEGVISDRVDTLWKLLLNWIDQIRKADFIFVACHSQGVPVAIMLVAKLVAFGCITPSTRVGVCAMAGVNLGPFAGLQSRFLDRSAGELFEFGKPDSTVSKMYTSAVEQVLNAGVRILYIGSIDDQLVSLEVIHRSLDP
jgi:hypothetical protein